MKKVTTMFMEKGEEYFLNEVFDHLETQDDVMTKSDLIRGVKELKRDIVSKTKRGHGCDNEIFFEKGIEKMLKRVLKTIDNSKLNSFVIMKKYLMPNLEKLRRSNEELD